MRARLKRLLEQFPTESTSFQSEAVRKKCGFFPESTPVATGWRPAWAYGWRQQRYRRQRCDGMAARKTPFSPLRAKHASGKKGAAPCPFERGKLRARQLYPARAYGWRQQRYRRQRCDRMAARKRPFRPLRAKHASGKKRAAPCPFERGKLRARQLYPARAYGWRQQRCRRQRCAAPCAALGHFQGQNALFLAMRAIHRGPARHAQLPQGAGAAFARLAAPAVDGKAVLKGAHIPIGIPVVAD